MLSVIMLSVVTLCVIMLSVIMLSVVMLHGVVLSVAMLRVIILSGTTQNVILLRVVLLRVMAPGWVTPEWYLPLSLSCVTKKMSCKPQNFPGAKHSSLLNCSVSDKERLL